MSKLLKKTTQYIIEESLNGFWYRVFFSDKFKDCCDYMVKKKKDIQLDREHRKPERYKIIKIVTKEKVLKTINFKELKKDEKATDCSFDNNNIIYLNDHSQPPD